MGYPLARRLVQLGYSVKGSTTTQEKLSSLEKSKIKAFHVTATPQLKGEGIDSFFQSKILILNIPFRHSLKDPNYYRQQIDSVIAHVEKSPIEFVIFASSTSVYPASTKLAVEDEPIVPDNPRSKTLRGIEQSLMANPKFQSTVIRFSGLYGGERRIGQILAGRKGVADGDSPVNLIHLEDCVEIVVEIIQKKVCGEIINACSDGHPTRKEIYTKAAIHYGLKPPQFADQPSRRSKIVSNSKLKEKLGYIFRHPDPLDF